MTAVLRVRGWVVGVVAVGCLLAGCGTGEQTSPPADTPAPGPSASGPSNPVPSPSGPDSGPSTGVPATGSPAPGSPAPSSPAADPTQSAPPTGPGTPPDEDPPKDPATTPVPQPSEGGVKTRVAPKKVVTKAPVPVNVPAEVDQDLTVRIERTEAIEAKATLPGEIAGPAVVFDLVADNKTAAPVDLSAVVVECTDAAKAPCNRISSEPAAPFTGTVPAGASATGRYVFVIPKDQRGSVSLVVTLTGDRPVVVFQGKVG